MKIVLLDTLTFGDADLSGFAKFGEVVKYETTSPEQTPEHIRGADVIITNKVVITDEHMQNTPSLKLICIAATGMNNVDLEAAKQRGISVKNVAGYSTDSVVQHTFSMLFYLIGHARYYDEYVKNGEYAKSPVFTHVAKPFFELKNKTWGIIGLGEIGRGVAKAAEAFGARITYFSTSGANHSRDYRQVELNELLQYSDIITIHAPLNEKTNNLLDYEQLSFCKEGAVILNLGRGGIINEDAVAKIIDEKNIYFGLDVLCTEPIAADHPLLGIQNKENLYITPHIAWTSNEARATLMQGVVTNIEEFIK